MKFATEKLERGQTIALVFGLSWDLTKVRRRSLRGTRSPRSLQRSAWHGTANRAAQKTPPGKTWVPQSAPSGCKCFPRSWLLAASVGGCTVWGWELGTQRWTNSQGEQNLWRHRGCHRQRALLPRRITHSLVKHGEGCHKVILENEVSIVWHRACGWATAVIQRCLMYWVQLKLRRHQGTV